jgi:hypothetical protein
VIDWGSFALVAAVSLLGAVVLVGFASLGIRLWDSATTRRLGARAGAIASFAVCAAAVAYGVYLVVPTFH